MKSWAYAELQKFEQLTHYKRYEMSSQIFDSFHEGKRKLIHPFVLSEEMYANTWLNSQQKKKKNLCGNFITWNILIKVVMNP